MPGRVLIVDDSKMERVIISTSIKRRLFDVDIFENADGEGIIDLLIEHKIQVCILDILLPKRNGFDILKEIKENTKTQDILVLVCTGMSQKESIERALSLGAYDYFAKPLSEEVMNIALPLKIKNAIDLMIRKEEIMYLSYHDTLTGLYNRRFIQEELSHIDFEKNLPIGIIMGDANGLKLTNDAFGHEAGDLLLQRIADIMQKNAPEGAIIARIGGDEFCIVLLHTKEKAIETYISKIKETCEKQPGDPLKPNISLGFEIKTNQRQRIHDVYQQAENNMYSNKINESNRVKKAILKRLMQFLTEIEKSYAPRLAKIEKLCLKMGKEAHIGFHERIQLKLLAKYHDIGLTAVSLKSNFDANNRQNQSTGLWEIEDNHCELGYRIANVLPDIAPVSYEILCHHEKWDGTGFPQKLQGVAIPLNARILFVAEHYIQWLEALKQNEQEEDERTLKKIVLDGMHELSGTYFDPLLIEILEEIEKKEMETVENRN